MPGQSRNHGPVQIHQLRISALHHLTFKMDRSLLLSTLRLHRWEKHQEGGPEGGQEGLG